DAAIEKVRAYLDDATGSTLGLKRIEAIATLLLSDDPADKLPGRFFIRFWLAALDHEDLKPRSLASHQNTRNLLARSIAAGKEAGTVRPSLDDRQAAELVLALILGLATEIAIDRSLMTPDRATELIRVLLQSFGGSAGPPPQISSEGTVEAMLQPLKEDQSLEPAAREELAGAIRHLYRLAQHWR